MTLLDHLSLTSVASVVAIGIVTTLLGGLLTVGVFRLVDQDLARHEPDPSTEAPDEAPADTPDQAPDDATPSATPAATPTNDVEAGTVTAAGTILRGGAWVGALERIAVFSSLVLGWPEGIAVVLAIKGLGRYADLKSPDGAAGERFIIGTFTSLLSAALGAGLALWAASAITP